MVVPKSLVFNWKQEAARFTPRLRVLDHTGLTRDVNGFADCDVVLTTYGTLRRDAAEFKDIEFDYVVLDEAQAIKPIPLSALLVAAGEQEENGPQAGRSARPAKKVRRGEDCVPKG